MRSDLERLAGKTVLVTGSDGMLGRAFTETLDTLGFQCQIEALTRERLDVTDQNAVLSCSSMQPDYIVHCAALVDADACEREPLTCRPSHVDGTLNMARLASETGARVLYPQSFLIFDGRDLPVTERTPPAPLSAYGRFKLEAEQGLVALLPDTLVVRMGGFFGGDEKDKNFVGKFTRSLVGLLAGGVRRHDVGDRVWQPSYTMDLAQNCLLLLARGESGVYNMAAKGEAAFHEVAAACVEMLGLSDDIAIDACSASVLAMREEARRPRRVVLANARLEREGLDRQRDWRDGLREYLARPYFERLFHGVRQARR